MLTKTWADVELPDRFRKISKEMAGTHSKQNHPTCATALRGKGASVLHLWALTPLAQSERKTHTPAHSQAEQGTGLTTSSAKERRLQGKWFLPS